MPEYPDIVVYIEALEQRLLDQTLKRITIASPFLLRTAAPPINSVEGRKVVQLRRLGKRICFGFDDEHWLVLHLMIAGRLHWHERPVKTSKVRLATYDFTKGTLSLTEAGSQRRASIHLVHGTSELERFNPGGIEIFETDLAGFAAALQSANHTLKRALTDPRLFSGIGNAYSDEILWEARLSPVALTQKLAPEQIERLYDATRGTLTKWTDLLRHELVRGSSPTVRKGVVDAGSKRGRSKRSSEELLQSAFPENVTAFRPEMATHGKYGQPCPRCGSKIQRIRYASNETNYCPVCQTAGKLLADRSLSRLLRADWPRTADELENLTRQ
ncbi:MAG TPA: DNA-formamidopyrimidine glycosylase family protein [Pyrinomonadaceae bacterium]|nr:DNA-formamidopyrimidine glycosylase family protein [Pyrinomonadaceae bacterium]